MKIAIVDDDKDFIQKMREYIARWQTENNTPCTVQSFTNAVNFLEPYSADWDIVFLDIEMPLMNGLEAAKKLRKLRNAGMHVNCFPLSHAAGSNKYYIAF